MITTIGNRSGGQGITAYVCRAKAGIGVLALAFFMGMGLLAGCGGSGSSEEAAADEGMLPEAIAVRDAFADAKASMKGPIRESLRLVKNGAQNSRGYADALPTLQRMATNPNVTPEQKQALEALVQRLRSELAAARQR